MALGKTVSILDRTLLALADPTRREILQRLSAGPERVTGLAAPFAMSLNAVSKHIRILEKARLVARQRIGREHYLTLRPEPVDEALRWMESQRAFWSQRLNVLASELKNAPSDEPEPQTSET